MEPALLGVGCLFSGAIITLLHEKRAGFQDRPFPNCMSKQTVTSYGDRTSHRSYCHLGCPGNVNLDGNARSQRDVDRGRARRHNVGRQDNRIIRSQSGTRSRLHPEEIPRIDWLRRWFHNLIGREHDGVARKHGNIDRVFGTWATTFGWRGRFDGDKDRMLRTRAIRIRQDDRVRRMFATTSGQGFRPTFGRQNNPDAWVPTETRSDALASEARARFHPEESQSGDSDAHHRHLSEAPVGARSG